MKRQLYFVSETARARNHQGSATAARVVLGRRSQRRLAAVAFEAFQTYFLLVFDNGYLTVGSFRGTPIRFHWSTALGAFFFGGFQFAPAFWLAFVLLVLVHELGHAFLVQRLGHVPLGIEVTGFGGLCRWDGRRSTELHRTIIAWGGVLAQGVLLIATYVYASVSGPPTSVAEHQIVSAFTRTNIQLILLNLLPFPPLDGAQAWQILTYLGRFARKR